MSLREHMPLIAICLFAAAGSGAVVALLLSGAGHPAPPRKADLIRSIPVQTSSIPAVRLKPALTSQEEVLPPATAPLDHFGFVPLHATDELFAALAEEEIGAEDPSSWTAETTTATSPQSIVRLPGKQPQQLPWENEPIVRGKPYSLTERLREIGPSAQERLQAKFSAAKAPWRPSEMALVAIKDEKVLELHARPAGGSWTFIHRYPVLAASGVTGPKLRRGDKQVPEGVYGISFLNPNSRYHVALRVSYPNAFDRRMGERDGRRDLGGDIMIHGKAASVGCLAVGDEAAEELFVLAAETGLKNIKLVIAPTDFRSKEIPPIAEGQPSWLPQLYTEVASAMTPYKAPPNQSLLSYFFN
ncbi:MAG: L,D-transpeptidase family protein [Deltaproteobacteria bacterium]